MVDFYLLVYRNVEDVKDNFVAPQQISD